MNYLRDIVAVSFIITGVFCASSAHAATVRIGSVVVIERELEGVFSGENWNKKFKGDDVFETEYVRTSRESKAQIELIDKLNILIGPAATLRFDRVVFKPNNAIGRVDISAKPGAYRIISGTSPSMVTTSTASISPEGTAYDLLVEEMQTFVVLREGKIRVCTLGAGPTCKTVSRPGDTIIATSAALEGPRRGGPAPSDFAN